MKDDERTMEIPTDEDENVGDMPKKKIKKKKTKEEREADRKVVFWTLIIVLGITIFFWMWPRIKNFKFGMPNFNLDFTQQDDINSQPKKEMKNYIEYKL